MIQWYKDCFITGQTGGLTGGVRGGLTGGLPKHNSLTHKTLSKNTGGLEKF